MVSEDLTGFGILRKLLLERTLLSHWNSEVFENNNKEIEDKDQNIMVTKDAVQLEGCSNVWIKQISFRGHHWTGRLLHKGDAEEKGMWISVCSRLSLLRGRKSGLSQLCPFIHPKCINQRSHLSPQIKSEYRKWRSEIPGVCVGKLPSYVRKTYTYNNRKSFHTDRYSPSSVYCFLSPCKIFAESIIV